MKGDTIIHMYHNGTHTLVFSPEYIIVDGRRLDKAEKVSLYSTPLNYRLDFLDSSQQVIGSFQVSQSFQFETLKFMLSSLY